MQSTSVFLFAFLLYLSHFKCDSRDTITSSNILSNKRETLVSAGQIFELGLFNTTSEDGEFRNYVGIWYRESPKTIVWVANRDKPIPISGIIVIDVDGNLKVLNSRRNSYFSTGLVSASSSKRTAKLYDSGNLVLIDDLSGKRLWESFDNPTDTFLPGMKMNDALKLTAWKDTQKDPSTGNYTFRLKQAGSSEYIIVEKTVLHWKGSASANPFNFRELPSFVGLMLTNLSTNNTSLMVYLNNTRRQRYTQFLNKLGTHDISSVSEFKYTRLVMNSSGEIQLYGWYNKSRGWFRMWSEPQGSCDVNDICGKFGICNSRFMSLCKCLPGFDPASPDDWMNGICIDGCSRKSVSSCNKKSESDTFLNMNLMKFKEPDMPYVEAESEQDCRKGCLSNCKCLAYSYVDVPKAQRETSSTRTIPSCWIWTSDLINLQENYAGGFNLSVRVAVTDIGAITRRNCKPCGSNIIPYPLSSQPNCGDPLYHSFSCDDLTGEARFQTLNGSYPVIDIVKENRTFVIQVHAENVGNSCDTKTQAVWLNQSLPFDPINRCYEGKLQNLNSGGLKNEIQIMWKPPPEPTCTTSADCVDWPNSSCNIREGQGQRRCLCNQYYKWDDLVLNCTREHAGQRAWSGEKATSLNLKALIISVSLTAAIITICYVIYHRKKVARRKEAKKIILGDGIEYLSENGSSSKYLITEDDKKRIDVPFFNLESILVATDNFSDANRLGQGGFGPVYKGKFPQGQEMAVKRLSSYSSQGAEEFKNEVMLIAKLQHRNLVRLLGYCIEANEKILLYEYLPNKSLDTRIFDHSLPQLLTWNIRFEIILGIARGLVYLHHDSRLRIIHRDLKTSNILLDEDLNAKISDFGLARIVEGKTIDAKTQKVAGTYGYLAPEYALEGLFSIKSDVFAFGVVVLEIISGNRNLELFEDTNLLGHAWKLWMENKALEIMDESLVDSFNEIEVVKCINIALLCVQEDPGDRPIMSNVIIMLGSENMPLPRPNQPAFVTRKNYTTAATTSSSSTYTNNYYYNSYTGSNNEMTITDVQGR